MKLELETREVDYLMGVLMERPWKECNSLIQKILSQANDVSFQAKILSDPPKTEEKKDA